MRRLFHVGALLNQSPTRRPGASHRRGEEPAFSDFRGVSLRFHSGDRREILGDKKAALHRIGARSTDFGRDENRRGRFSCLARFRRLFGLRLRVRAFASTACAFVPAQRGTSQGRGAMFSKAFR